MMCKMHMHMTCRITGQHDSDSKFSKKTFHYNRAAILWNKLPPNIRVNFNTLSINQFKNAITLYIYMYKQNA